MKQILTILGPVPAGSNTAITGFVLLVVGLLGLLSIPAQIARANSLKMNSHNLWPKMAFQLVVLVAFIIGGLVILSKRL